MSKTSNRGSGAPATQHSSKSLKQLLGLSTGPKAKPGISSYAASVKPRPVQVNTVHKPVVTDKPLVPGNSPNAVALPGPIPLEEWTMPVALDGQGNEVTLNEFKGLIASQRPVQLLAELSETDRQRLVIHRIRRRSDQYAITIGGFGRIDRDAAVTEIQNKSEVGQMLVEIEQQVVRNMMTKIR